MTGSVKRKVKDYSVDAMMIFAGSLIYALSVTVFTAPNNIAPGGITGIATVINHFFDIRIGLLIFIINIPIMIIALSTVGWKFVARSLVALTVSSVMIDAIDIFLPNLKYIEEPPLLSAIFGGVISGAGLSLIYLRGATTGGSDMCAKIVNHYKPHMKLGMVMMVVDMIIVLGATIAYRFGGVENNIQLALLDIVNIFLCSLIVDKVMDGFDMGKMMFIISSMPKEISDDIMQKMDRGATVLKGVGAYSGDEKNILMCAVRRNEAFTIKRIVYERDPSAFIIVGDATQIYGEGFKPIKTEEDK